MFVYLYNRYRWWINNTTWFFYNYKCKKNGKNCKIFQQVTIGYNGDEQPIIGDNVVVCCGAKIIGGVKVGNNVIIGANAVVCKDIPDNVVVAGVPAKIIKYIE